MNAQGEAAPSASSEGSRPEPAAQDRRFAVTFFAHASAAERRQELHSPSSLADLIETTDAAQKAALPWLKLARFGDLRSAKGSLRHDANVQAITGIEADYDGGAMPFAEAEEILLKANVLTILHTSPSHTENSPRWRLLCPTSTELPPKERGRLLGRLNGLFRGISLIRPG